MCGIVGYIGHQQALPILLSGLHDLEYRGYDSAGVAVLDDGKLNRVREVGKVEMLTKKMDGQKLHGIVGIGHTRWATHGGVTEKNAHPHVAMDGKIAIVHNGIIENYRELKKKLENNGVKFESETDTEVLAHLIAGEYESLRRDFNAQAGSTPILQVAVAKALQRVRGTYGILVIHTDHPNELVAARFGSPIVIGYGEGENYVASDITPLLPYTKRVAYLNDGQIAVLGSDTSNIYNLENKPEAAIITTVDWDQAKAQKQGFEHFMLKEIWDQPTVFEDAIRGRVYLEDGTARLGGLNMSEKQMREIKRIVIIAEGTARHSGMIGKYAFERWAELPVEVDFSSEFRYRDPVLDEKTLVFAISQSGETADTLMAIKEAKHKGAVVRGIVNVVGSTIARETGAGTYIHAGPELAVASTKAYTNMVAVLILYALQFGRLKHITIATGQRILKALLEIPQKMNKILEKAEEVKRIAAKYAKYENLLFLGRGVNYPVAMEGSLKLKEISYIHSEAFAGGELKHGPLALVNEKMPAVAILTKNQLYEKMKSNVQEVKARGGKIILVASEGDKEAAELADDVLYVPKTMELLEPLLNTIPLQLFAYHMAVKLGRDVDRPRNLAKSVTVE
ncbi:MAG: glutamine--fructose-6-phosphate transaminase (isomerizing) [bacterium]|nr:glutamine--fructose-6-phosphate transaminase (isomerizing) [bacterium]